MARIFDALCYFHGKADTFIISKTDTANRHFGLT
jgi:hypothetical protein